jgi:2'-5' RNA ligase
MRNFWRTHQWPVGERRLHWLVEFDRQPAVHSCYAAHLPVLERHQQLVDIVPVEWLHLTVQSLCPMPAVAADDLDTLVTATRHRLSRVAVPHVQLGPARIDGGAVTWAVYPEEGLSHVQEAVRLCSTDLLGAERVAQRRGRWSPHVTLGYGAADGPADDLAAALAFTGLPRVETAITDVALVDMEQDFAGSQYRWKRLAGVKIGGIAD